MTLSGPTFVRKAVFRCLELPFDPFCAARIAQCSAQIDSGDIQSSPRKCLLGRYGQSGREWVSMIAPKGVQSLEKKLKRCPTKADSC